jgi:hypothetical protein
MILLALDIAIAVVKARNAIVDLIPDVVKDKAAELAGKLDLVKIALTAGKWIMGLFVASIVVVAAIFAVIIAVIGGAIAVIGGLVVAVSLAAVAIGKAVVGGVSKLLELGSAGADAAKNMIAGLVSGIQAGVGPVVAAIKAMAGSAVAAIKAALKIASPSKIFEDMGEFTGEGFAVGIEGETAHVQSSLETMVAPPSVESPAVPSRAAAVGGSDGGSKVDLSGATFIFNGIANAESAVSAFEEALTRVLEGDAIAVGAA